MSVSGLLSPILHYVPLEFTIMYLDNWNYMTFAEYLWNTQVKGSSSDPSLLSISKF